MRKVFTKRNLIAVGLFFTGVVVTIVSLNYSDVGSSDDVTLQINGNVFRDDGLEYEISETSASGFEYSNLSNTNLDTQIEENTFIVTGNIAENGIPDEILAIDAFTPDGSPMWVYTNEVNIRVNPSVTSEIITTVEYSKEITRLSYGSEWSYVRLEDGTEGYVLSSLLTDEYVAAPTATPMPTPTPTLVPMIPSPNSGSSTADEEYTETECSMTVYASCSLNMRSGPGVGYSLVSVLTAGQEITVTAQTSNGWYRTYSGNYVKSSLCTDTAPVAPTAPAAGSTDVDVSAATGDFATYCLSFVGVPYVYAGMSPSGFDCSGYVSYIMANYYGISLPHNASEISQLGTAVSADSIQAGDVMCHDYNGDGYIDHVSLYIGGGVCVHASNSRSGVVSCAYPMGSVVTIRRFI